MSINGATRHLHTSASVQFSSLPVEEEQEINLNEFVTIDLHSDNESDSASMGEREVTNETETVRYLIEKHKNHFIFKGFGGLLLTAFGIALCILGGFVFAACIAALPATSGLAYLAGALFGTGIPGIISGIHVAIRNFTDYRNARQWEPDTIIAFADASNKQITEENFRLIAYVAYNPIREEEIESDDDDNAVADQEDL